MTSRKQTSQSTGEQLMFFPEDSHVNHIPLQENVRERKMNATYGLTCVEQFERYSRNGSWAKTFSGLLVGMTGWYSRRCKLTWSLKGTKYNRLYFQLLVSALPTNDIESGLLLTPTTREEIQDLDKFKERMEKYPNGTTMPNLATQV